MSMTGLSRDYSAYPENAIAILSMACRFPLADDASSYWEKLCAGTEAVRSFSVEELRASGVTPQLLNDRSFVNAGATIEGIELFDAEFFGFTPKEAEILDPQQRVLLECAYHALEQAGYAERRPGRDVGVFFGTASSSYAYENLFGNTQLVQTMGPTSILIANERDFAAPQVAYRLDLTGPAVNISTACSTSLVAIHHAVRALLNHECHLALAGGAKVQAQQAKGHTYVEGGIRSADGHCRPFSQDARGTIEGNGAGVVLLKTLRDAIADGDSIEAVIVGSAVNNDGADKVGIAAPSVKGQARVIHEALADAGVEAGELAYVECQGSGTRLGDQVEVAALKEVFRHFRRKGRGEEDACALGSVKSNMGNLDAAAGVAGFMKAALAVKHGKVPPSLHCEPVNPQLDLSEGPFYVADRLHDWPRPGARRFAGVSSFGIGGTNAHVVLASPPVAPRLPDPRSPCVLVLSAKSPVSLVRGIESLRDELLSSATLSQGPRLLDVAYSLSLRPEYPHRFAIVAHNCHDAAWRMDLALREGIVLAEGARAKRNLTWMMDEPGAVYWSWAKALYDTEVTFRECFDSCVARFGVNRDEAVAVLTDAEHDDAASSPTSQAAARFSSLLSVASLYLSLGIPLGAVGGSGIGAVVAAHLSGALDLDDAIRLALALANADAPNKRDLIAAVLREVRLKSAHRPWLRASDHLPTEPHEPRSPDFWLRAWESGSGRNAVPPLRFVLGPSEEIARLDVPQEQSRASHWLEAASILWTRSWPVDLRKLYAGRECRRVLLPGYCFDRKRFWISPHGWPAGNLSQESLENKVEPDVRHADRAFVGDPHDERLAQPLSLPEVESVLSEIYRQLIGEAPRAGRDNFFEMGGDSLSATQLCLLIRQRFAIELPLESVFDMPEASRLAERICSARDQQSSREQQMTRLLNEIETMEDEKLERLLRE